MDLWERIAALRATGLSQADAYQQAVREKQDDPSLLDRAKAGIQGTPGYDKVRDVAVGASEAIAGAATGLAGWGLDRARDPVGSIKGIPAAYGQFAAGLGDVGMTASAGIAETVGMDAQPIRDYRDQYIEQEYGAPDTGAQLASRMAGTLSPYLALPGMAMGRVGLKGAAGADVALDYLTAAGDESYSLAGMAADIDPDAEGMKGSVRRVADQLTGPLGGIEETAASPVKRGVAEALPFAALAYGPSAVASGYGRLRGMGEAGAAVNPLAEASGRVPGQVESGMQGRWYSRLRRAVEEAPQDVATAEQWQGMIRKAKEGVSESEREWSGLDAFLESRAGQKVTRDELLEQVGPGIGLAETVRGQKSLEAGLNMDSPYMTPAVRRIVTQDQGSAEDALWLTLSNDGDAYRELMRKFPELADDEDWADTVLREVVGTADSPEVVAPKFESYKQPGGENYREVLVQLEGRSTPDPVPIGARVENFGTESSPLWAVVRDDDGAVLGQHGADRARAESHAETVAAMGSSGELRTPSNTFQSSHFDEPNVLAHLRMTDRTVDGEKTLFIEEIQSDWHQKGRTDGYRGEPLTPDRYEIVTERDLSSPAGGDLYVVRDKQRGSTVSSFQTRAEAESYMKGNPDRGVPDAPLKGTDEWVGLSFRRALQEAAQGGYDRVAWASGEQAADLYDLRKQVARVEYDESSGILSAVDHGGERVLYERGVRPEQLPDYIGKDPAQRLMEQQPGRNVEIEEFRDRFALKDADTGEILGSRPTREDAEALLGWEGYRLRTIEGEDLAVGGAGMDEFYNKIVPKAVQKEAKRLGVTIEPVSLPTGKEVPSDDWAVFDPVTGDEVARVANEADARAMAEAEQLEYSNTRRPQDAGPTNLSIRLTPQAREKILNEGLRLGATVGEVPAAIARTGAGAAVGAAVDEEDPLRGAAIGGGLAGYAPAAARGLRGMGQAGHLVTPSDIFDPLEAKIRQIEGGGADALEQRARRIEARRLAQQVQADRERGVLRGMAPEERAFGEMSDDELLDKWAQYQRGGGRATMDAEIATINDSQRTVHADGTVTAGISSRSQSGAWARGRKTQAEKRIAQIETEISARGIDVRDIDPYLNVSQSGVMESNKELVGRGGAAIRSMSDADLEKEIRATLRMWERNRESREAAERMAILYGETTRPGRAVDPDVFDAASRAGFVAPEALVPLVGGAGGATLGGVTADEGEDRGGRMLAGFIGGAGLAGMGVRKILGTGADDIPLSGLKAAGAPAQVTVTQRALKEANEVNLKNFNLDTTGEERLRRQVARIIDTSRASDLGRKPVTWGETRAVANELGLNASDLDKVAASRMSGAELLAVRDIVSQNIDDLVKIENRLRTSVSETGLPLTRSEIEEAQRLANSLTAQNEQMTRKFLKARASMGRDLNSMKILANRTLDPITWSAKAQKIKGSPLSDAEGKQLRRLLAAGDRADLVRFVGGLYDAPMTDKVITLWKAGLLTNPATHMGNLYSNFTMAALETMKDTPSAFFDRLAYQVSGVRTKDGISPQTLKAGWDAVDSDALRGVARVLLEPTAGAVGGAAVGEAIGGEDSSLPWALGGVGALGGFAHAIKGMPANASDAALLAKYDISRQVNFDKWAGSAILNAYAGPHSRIFGSLSEGDKVFRSLAIGRYMNEQARVMAKAEGLKGADLLKRVDEIIEMDAQLHLRAIESAEVSTFLNKGGHTTFKRVDLAEAGEGFRRGLGPVGHFVVPFTRTPANVTDRVLEYSPVGFMADLPKMADWLQKVQQGKRSGGLNAEDLVELQALQREMVEQAGRATVGTTAVLAGAVLAHNKLLSGNYPADQAERNVQDLTRQQPHSIRVGDEWLALDRLSPLGNLLTLGAELYTMSQNPETGVSGAIAATPGVIGKTVVDQSFLRGVQGALDAVSDPERSMANWARSTAGSIVPAGVYGVTRAIDPTLRDPQSIPEAVKGRLPGLSKTITPTRDAFGEERQRSTSAVGRLGTVASPFTFRRSREDDPVRKEIGETGTSLTRYRPSGIERGTPEYDQLQQMYGQVTREATEQAMRSPEYRSAERQAQRLMRLPENEGRSLEDVTHELQAEIIRDAVSRARSALTRQRSNRR